MTTFPVFSAPSQLAGSVSRLARELVPVPEWKLSFWVWELTGEQMEAYRQGLYRTRGTKTTLNLSNTTARLLTQALRHEDGRPIFDNEGEALHHLLSMPSAGLEKLAAVARRLNRMDDADEDIEGNSGAAPSGSSSSISPSLSDDLSASS